MEECQICYREFATPLGLHQHIDKKHNKNNSKCFLGHKCHKCGTTHGLWHMCYQCNNEYCSILCRNKDHIKCLNSVGLGCYSLERLGHPISKPKIWGDEIYVTA